MCIRDSYNTVSGLSTGAAYTLFSGVGGASIDLSQVIRRDHEKLCDGTVRLACVDVDSMRPRGIPKALASAIRQDAKK